MANRLQRIMAMDQMMQNRNMPQQGMQNVFNPTTGTFVNVPFQTDPNFKGRRTVMTPSGPQVLPGFEGVENPYRQLGRGVRNLLGNLFDRGSLRREERKREQTIEEASQDPQRSASRERVFDTMLDTMDPSVVQRPEFDPAVTNQARIDELQERINRPIMRGPAPLPIVTGKHNRPAPFKIRISLKGYAYKCSCCGIENILHPLLRHIAIFHHLIHRHDSLKSICHYVLPPLGKSVPIALLNRSPRFKPSYPIASPNCEYTFPPRVLKAEVFPVNPSAPIRPTSTSPVN